VEIRVEILDLALYLRNLDNKKQWAKPTVFNVSADDRNRTCTPLGHKNLKRLCNLSYGGFCFSFISYNPLKNRGFSGVRYCAFLYAMYFNALKKLIVKWNYRGII